MLSGHQGCLATMRTEIDELQSQMKLKVSLENLDRALTSKFEKLEGRIKKESMPSLVEWKEQVTEWKEEVAKDMKHVEFC